MSKVSRIVVGLTLAVGAIIIAGTLFLRHLIVKSFPVTTGSITIHELHAPVDVVRDDYGVPHIRASSEHDLMVATGYVHAQDRLWQMDILRRTGEGRLSEILGTPTVDFDLLFRTLGLRQVAERTASRLHPESKRILEEYAEGVNAFITSHAGKLPIEFDMLNYQPEPWRVEHSVLLAKLIAWDLNLAWWTDLTYGEIATRVSAEKLQELLPGFPDSIKVTVPSRRGTKDAAEVMQDFRRYRQYFGLGSLEAGSNAWAVDSSRSLSGKPLLANDPHLSMPMPSRWYELHLSAPGWDCAGVSLPGTPLIIIGHNRQIAWGLTNAMLDDADFYIEHIDSTHQNHYLFEKSSLPIDVHEETISVKGDDSITVTVRATHHGPIINDVHPMHRHGDSTGHHTPIAMRWTGMEPSDELYGFYRMNTASNPHEFENGLRALTAPGQSVVYADTSGVIAYWTAGLVPIRGKGNPMMPLQGWTGESEWKGFVPFEQLPKTINPPEGIIACANQKIADRNYPYYLSTLWEPPSRIVRIRQLLHSAEKFTADDFKQFQQDVMSIYARDVVPHLIQAFDSLHPPGERSDQALNYLHNWDFRFAQNDIATTLFNVFNMKLLHHLYADEMGDDVFRDFVYFGAIAYRVTAQLLETDSSSWFDNVSTSQLETKNEILRESFADAITELDSTFGPEMKTWQWGSLHTVTFKHIFGSRKPLDRVFNLGPFPLGGGGTTVNKSEYRFTAPYSTSVGPSLRQVVDLARPFESFLVITSGQSGQPLHKHYDDQTSLWLNGGYHRLTTDWDEIDRQHWDHLRLEP